MSLVPGTSPIDHHQQPSMRKLDDYGAEEADDGPSWGLTPSLRMRTDESTSCQNPPPSSPSIDSVGCSESEASVSQIQFFVSMISVGNTLVLKGYLNDTVEVVHKKIESITGIPMKFQRLIYRGKQLYWDKTLAECSIQNDAGLQLVGRMRGTRQPLAWRVINEFVSMIFRICRNDRSVNTIDLNAKLESYLESSPRREPDHPDGCDSMVIDYFEVFADSDAPRALVMLYMSSEKINKVCAENCIRCFINWAQRLTGPCERTYFGTIILEFCRLLKHDHGDVMYLFCLNTLGTIMPTVTVHRDPKAANGCPHFILFHDILPFLEETVDRVLKAGAPTAEAKGNDGPSERDVGDLSAFLHPWLKLVGSTEVPKEELMPYSIYSRLYDWADNGLKEFELYLATTRRAKTDGHICGFGWSLYLVVLEELNTISRVFKGAEDQFWAMINRRKAAFGALVAGYANPGNNSWLIDHKDVLDFESRRHLAMLMFPVVKEDYDEMHEMLIDRSQLLAESFEYILRAKVSSLHAGLFMKFKNEEATGPGVLREWFLLVSQEIFNPQNALFIACPHDRRRFFPNPASRVHLLHLDYFTFSGRIVALALMHKIQIGIVLDRSFVLQLAGKEVLLEDVKDADPYIYDSCKKMLDMDAELVDSDALGLTFVSEFDELGSREAVELCPGGKSMVVNSKNRHMYVSLLIKHRFVDSVSVLVSRFACGFGDILHDPKLRMSFFQCLELEDLDWLLSG